MGLALIEKGRYADARVQLEKISPEFDGRQEAIAKINDLMQKRTIDADLKQARNQLAQRNHFKKPMIYWRTSWPGHPTVTMPGY